MKLVDKDDILKDIADLQKSPWFNDGKDVESGRRLQYNVRKEAVEIVRDMCVNVAPTIDAIPVEWLQQRRDMYTNTVTAGNLRVAAVIDQLIRAWRKEQEAMA